MRKKPHKAYDRVNAAERAEATKVYDREGPGLPGVPLTRRDKAPHRRGKKMGRPMKGEGCTVVGVSIEKGLLKRADALARLRNVGRSELFVAALRTELAAALGSEGATSRPVAGKGRRKAS